MTLPAGEIADRFNQRRVLPAAMALQGVCALLFMVFSIAAPRNALPFYAVLVLFGAARGFSGPSGSSLLAFLVPRERLSRSIALSSSVFTTAVIAGGTYTICINAANGVGSAATQTFTLTVNAAPAFTSGSSTTFNTNVGGSFNVTTSGFPNPTLTNAAFAGCTPSTLPGTVTFADNSNGTGTISGNPGSSSGTYTLCLDASNGIGSAATQTFTLTVQPFTITGIYFTNITTSGTQNCSSQTVSQNITCTDGGMGGAGTFTASVEMVNSSGTPITNTSGGAITVSCSQTTVSSPGGTVSPSSSTIANGAVTTASTFTLTGGGAGWSGKMTCSVVVNSTTYTIAVTGS